MKATTQWEFGFGRVMAMEGMWATKAGSKRLAVAERVIARREARAARASAPRVVVFKVRSGKGGFDQHVRAWLVLQEAGKWVAWAAGYAACGMARPASSTVEGGLL